MATSSETASSPVIPSSRADKLSFVTLMLAMMLSVVLSSVVITGILAYLIRAGHFSLLNRAVRDDVVSTLVNTSSFHTVVLEPMTANLNDVGGSTYLKTTIALRIADDASSKTTGSKDEKPVKDKGYVAAALRDTILIVVGRESAEGLLAPGGKERLKAALRADLNERNSELKIVDIYFVDFLVQR